MVVAMLLVEDVPEDDDCATELDGDDDEGGNDERDEDDEEACGVEELGDCNDADEMDKLEEVTEPGPITVLLDVIDVDVTGLLFSFAGSLASKLLESYSRRFENHTHDCLHQFQVQQMPRSVLVRHSHLVVLCPILVALLARNGLQGRRHESMPRVLIKEVPTAHRVPGRTKHLLIVAEESFVERTYFWGRVASNLVAG